MKKIPVLLLGLVLFSSIVSGCGPTTDANITITPPGAPSALSGSPAVDTAAFQNQGDLALVWNGLLYNLDGSTGKVLRLTSTGSASNPAWSYDGQWLAYLRITDASHGSGTLWLVRRDGTQSHQVPGLPGPVFDFAWSPAADVLAVRGQDGLFVIPATGVAHRVMTVWSPGFAWSPDGKSLAFNVTLPWADRTNTADWGNRTDAIYTVGVEGGQPVRRVVAPDKGMIEVGPWWPDGKGLLYWLAPFHGGSVMADGLDLWSVALDQGTPKLLTKGLIRKDWLSYTPQGELLMVKGISRFPWEHKELAVVDVKTGAVTTLTNPAGEVSFDPALSPDGRRIAFVAARDMAGTRISGPAAVQAWLATAGLWVRNIDGSGAVCLWIAGGGVSNPVWSRDGNSILYARDNALWLVGADGGAPQKVVAWPSTGPYDPGFWSVSDRWAWYQPG